MPKRQPAAAAAAEEAAPAPFDPRVDLIGFVKELEKQIADPAKEALKGDMRAGTKLGGDYFDAAKISATETVGDVEAFVKLWEKGRITRAQFVGGIRLAIADVKELLSADDYAKVATTRPGEPRLVVTRKKGVTVELGEALSRLGEALAERESPSPG